MMLLSSTGQALMAAIIFVSEHGGKVAEWYVGMTRNPREALFGRHQVDESLGMYMWFEMPSHSATSAAVARLANHGFTRLDSSAEVDPVFIYIFRKTTGTKS